MREAACGALGPAHNNTDISQNTVLYTWASYQHANGVLGHNVTLNSKGACNVNISETTTMDTGHLF